MASGPRSSPSPAASASLARPHPDDAAELQSAVDEADRGKLCTADESEAYLRWLESGEGPCPVDFD